MADCWQRKTSGGVTEMPSNQPLATCTKFLNRRFCQWKEPQHPWEANEEPQTLAGRELTHTLARAATMVGKALQRLEPGTEVAAARRPAKGQRVPPVLATE